MGLKNLSLIGSRIMFNCPLVEIFEEYPIFPTIFQLRNFVGLGEQYFVRGDAVGRLHHLEMVWLHE